MDNGNDTNTNINSNENDNVNTNFISNEDINTSTSLSSTNNGLDNANTIDSNVSNNTGSNVNENVLSNNINDYNRSDDSSNNLGDTDEYTIDTEIIVPHKTRWFKIVISSICLVVLLPIVLLSFYLTYFGYYKDVDKLYKDDNSYTFNSLDDVSKSYELINIEDRLSNKFEVHFSARSLQNEELSEEKNNIISFNIFDNKDFLESNNTISIVNLEKKNLMIIKDKEEVSLDENDYSIKVNSLDEYISDEFTNYTLELRVNGNNINGSLIDDVENEIITFSYTDKSKFPEKMYVNLSGENIEIKDINSRNLKIVFTNNKRDTESFGKLKKILYILSFTLGTCLIVACLYDLSCYSRDKKGRMAFTIKSAYLLSFLILSVVLLFIYKFNGNLFNQVASKFIYPLTGYNLNLSKVFNDTFIYIYMIISIVITITIIVLKSIKCGFSFILIFFVMLFDGLMAILFTPFCIFVALKVFKAFFVFFIIIVLFGYFLVSSGNPYNEGDKMNDIIKLKLREVVEGEFTYYLSEDRVRYLKNSDGTFYKEKIKKTK